MSTCVWILTVDRGGQNFDSSEEQFAVLGGRALQVADETFDLIRHLIEGRAEFSQLSATNDLNALGKISGGDALRTVSQLADRTRELVREKETNNQGECGRDQTHEH